MDFLPLVAGPVQPEWSRCLNPKNPSGTRCSDLPIELPNLQPSWCPGSAVAVGDFRDQVEDLASGCGSHQFDVLGMCPRQGHCATGGTPKEHVGVRPIWF